METYDIGDLVRVVARFVNDAGAPEDPTSITFTVRDPRGNEASQSELQATNPTVGEFQWVMTQPFDESGVWWFRTVADGGVYAATERSVKVRKSVFVP